MKMVRLTALAFVVVWCSGSLFAQNPPQITNTVFDFDTLESERVSIVVRLTDPDLDESLTLTFSLVNGSALGISESQLQFAFKSKVFNLSSANVSNKFSVPSGTAGSTIEIKADVTDKDGLAASQTFRYRVVGVNQPPVISLSLRQPGSNAAGTESDPFRFGSLEFNLSIQDDRGVDDYTYGIQIITGSLCVNYPFFWFGREGLSPTVDIPLVASLMAFDATATVIDGVFTETVHRTVWVEPEAEGCNTGGSGNDPLDSVTATASPNPVSTGGFISLIGGMTTGDTSDYSAAWYLGSSTSGEQLIVNGWNAQYQAPDFVTTLNFKFKVNEIAGTGEKVKAVPVLVSSSGGGGGSTPPPSLPPDPNCGCVTGLPPGVGASADSTTVLGGETLGLSGVASDPNYPLGSPGPAPTVLWKIEDSGGLTGLNIIGATQVDAQLSTPTVDADKWILLSLNAKNQSNLCECLDYLQIQVLSELGPGPTGGSGAGLQYAWPGESFQPATGGTVAKNIAIPFQLGLKAVPSGFTSPTFKWQTNRSDGTFSPSDTSQEPTLLITGQAGETAINLSVTLTVTEAGDSSVSEQATANFNLSVTGSSTAPENVDFVMSEQSAEPGTLVTLEGYAESASPLVDVRDLDYFWTVVTGDGDPVDVLTSRNRAIFEVPTSTETSSSVNVTLVAGENGVPSSPVHKGLQIASPTLRFAHFGAGPTGGQILEVQLILVNDTEESVEDSGNLWFVKQDGTANSVMVDEELVEEGVIPFSIGAESSKMFKIVTPDEDLRVGWMAVSSPVPLEGIILFQYVDADSGRLLTETALFASETGRRVSTAVDGRAGAIGFAIANPSAETPVDVIVGIPIDGAALEVPLTLQPLEQKAQFLSQLHELVDANMNVSGTLVLEVQGSEGSVVTTVLRLTQAGLSTLPVAVRKE